MFRKIRVLQSGYFGSSGGSSPVAGGGTVGITTPSLYVDTLAAPDTEYSYSLPIGTKWFSIINQSVPVLKVAYNVGESGTTYREVPCGSETTHPLLDATASITIYYQSATAGGRIEIESWA
jgi:hypothetical protein